MNFPQASARRAASLVRATWLVTGIVKQWTHHSNKLHFVEIYSLRFEVDIFSEFILSHIVKPPPVIGSEVWTNFRSDAQTFVGHARSNQYNVNVIAVDLRRVKARLLSTIY